MTGTVVAQGDPGYDAARLLYSPRFGAVHPLAVVYCESAIDVSRTILWARANGVPLRARSGGHSYAGYSTTTGVVIDVSRLASGDRTEQRRMAHAPRLQRVAVLTQNSYGFLSIHGEILAESAPFVYVLIPPPSCRPAMQSAPRLA